MPSAPTAAVSTAVPFAVMVVVLASTRAEPTAIVATTGTRNAMFLRWRL